MDAHLSTTCPVLNPDAKAAFSKPGAAPTCQASRCKAKLVAVSFVCERCGGKYCVSHRWETDHACTGAKAGASGSGKSAAGGGAAKGLSGLAALRRAQASMKSATRASAGKPIPTSGPPTAAGKRTAASAGGSKNATTTSAPAGTKGNPLMIDGSDDDVQVVTQKTAKTSGKASGGTSLAAATHGVLGSKTDKRAAAERASARKALEARAKKG